MSEVIFTDANFAAEVLQSERPVLVDFFATWCGPCRLQGPIIDELAQEAGAAFKVGKLDVDANPVTAQKFAVMSVPTIMIFKNGAVKETLNGVQTKETLREKLNAA